MSKKRDILFIVGILGCALLTGQFARSGIFRSRYSLEPLISGNIPFGNDTSLANANASFLGEASNDQAGYSVAGAGDINGDGFEDFLISAYYNHAAGEDSGQVYLIFGNATIGNGCAKNMGLGTANASFTGEAAYDYAGCSVAGVGDVNGDGFDDLLIGANGNDVGGGSAGQAYLILGNATIGNGCAKHMGLGAANASFIGETANDQAGYSVAGVGDVNMDGCDDMLIGAFGNSAGGSSAGQAYLILGNATIGNGCAIDMSLGVANASFIGEAANNMAGKAVGGAGDVNGDGYDDILIGAVSNGEGGSNAGQAYLILGRATIGNGSAKDINLGAANASFIGEASGNSAGRAVGGAGDVNGDGFDDILVGADGNDEGGTDAGEAYLILGNVTIGNGCAKDMRLGLANASFIDAGAYCYTGWAVAGAGDVNGDGCSDFLIGAYAAASAAGQAFLILGWDLVPPIITGAGIAPGTWYNATPPVFSLSFTEARPHMTWYSFDSGATNTTVLGTVGVLAGWESLGTQGPVAISLWMNDTYGNPSARYDIILNRDTIKPTITSTGIVAGAWYNTTPPAFSLSFTESNPNCSWYSFNGGATNTTVLGTAGVLAGWESLGTQGSVTVSFWMNDTAGIPSERFNLLINRDTIGPAIVTDLQVSFPTLEGFVLSWTAPGDNGGAGSVTGYVVKYSRYPITEANFSIATTYAQIWTSLSSGGTREARVITSLDPSTLYFFAIKAFDKSGNYSESISNVAIGTTSSDVTNPSVAGSSDITYRCGTMGHHILWFLADGTICLPTYRIFRDGTEVASSQAWPASGVVNFSVDELPAGTYSFTIYVADGYGNVVVDEITVTVTAAVATQTDPEPVDWNLITLVVAGIILTSMIVIIVQNIGLRKLAKILRSGRSVDSGLQPAKLARNEPS